MRFFNIISAIPFAIATLSIAPAVYPPVACANIKVFHVNTAQEIALARTFYDEGKTKMQQGDYEKAMICFSKALENDCNNDNNTEVYFERAICAIELAKKTDNKVYKLSYWHSAENDLQTALEKNTSYEGDAWFLRGWLAMEIDANKSNNIGAVTKFCQNCFQKAIEKETSYLAESYVYLGNTYKKGGDAKDVFAAKAAYEKALEYDQSCVAAMNGIQEIQPYIEAIEETSAKQQSDWLEMARNDLARAQKRLQKFIDSEGEDALYNWNTYGYGIAEGTVGAPDLRTLLNNVWHFRADYEPAYKVRDTFGKETYSDRKIVSTPQHITESYDTLVYFLVNHDDFYNKYFITMHECSMPVSKVTGNNSIFGRSWYDDTAYYGEDDLNTIRWQTAIIAWIFPNKKTKCITGTFENHYAYSPVSDVVDETIECRCATKLQEVNDGEEIDLWYICQDIESQIETDFGVKAVLTILK